MLNLSKFNSNKLPLYVVSIFLCATFLFILGGKTGAISGANTFFPDTSPGGQARSYGIVQVTGSLVYYCTNGEKTCTAGSGLRVYNAQSKMKAQSTIASIYVPKSLVAGNQQVSFNIIEACGFRNRDNDAGNGFSEFSVKNMTTGSSLAFKSSSSTASDCDGSGNIAVSFNPDDLDSSNVPVYKIARTIDNGTEYYIYSFRAEGVMNEKNSTYRYLNAFQLESATSGVLVGISDYPAGCDDVTYTISCPGKRAYNNGNGTSGYKSWVYSSFYGPTAAQSLPNYSQRINIRNSCASSGAISIYDVDASDAKLTQNLTLTLTKSGAAVSFPSPLGPQTVMPKAAIQNWEPGWYVLGQEVVRPHPDTAQNDYGGNNNEYMDIPGGDPTFAALGSFDKDTDYVLTLGDIDSDNAFQMLPSIAHCDASSEPVGYIDSCILSGRNVILYGWAYDNDGSNSSQPQVNVSATGQAVQTVDSAYDYRSGDINTFLNANSYGSAAQDNRYGFQVTYAGMTKGNTYSISGTIVNVGAGSDKALGINSPAFMSGNTIPDSCLPVAPPTCAAFGGTYTIGVSSKLTTASATNTNISGAMTIKSAKYVIKNVSGVQIAAGSDTTNLNIPAKSGGTNGSNNYDGENHTILTAGQYEVTWTMDWEISGVSDTITCKTPAIVPPTNCSPNPCNPCNGSLPCVTYLPPTCGSVPVVIGSVGLAFPEPERARATINNPNVVPLPITYVTYVISGPYIGTNRSGSGSNFGDIGASTDRTYNFTDNISRPSMIEGGPNQAHTVTWTVVNPGGTINCGGDIRIVVKPPICSANPTAAGTGDRFGPEVNVSNPNAGANMKMNSIVYVINPGAYSGAVAAADLVAPQPPVSKTYTGSETQIPTPGEYTSKWTVSWEVAPMSQTRDCGAYDPDGDGNPNPDTVISNQAYVRFYGNDLFAGGGFGSNCSSTGVFDARGYGRNATHDTYMGTASELAVFAIDKIQNVLPGSQLSRTGPQALAFANTTSLVDPASDGFGGGFGSVICSPDYYSKATSAVALAGASADISALASGSYRYGNGVGTTTVLTTGAGVADGKRIVIYVDGNVQISDSSGRFGYSNVAGNWASFSDIPSLYVIASGNIYIDNDVTTMDGVFVAQPRAVGDDKGQIYTCSRNATNPLTGLNSRAAGGNAEFILNECDNTKLIVNGAFMAKQVHLLRSVSTVNNGSPYETDTANNAAEVFRFTPELYLIEGGGLPPRSTNAKIDSIVALPPAF